MQITRAQKEFVKNLGEYREMRVQINTLLLGDVSENFRTMRFKIFFQLQD